MWIWWIELKFMSWIIVGSWFSYIYFHPSWSQHFALPFPSLGVHILNLKFLYSPHRILCSWLLLLTSAIWLSPNYMSCQSGQPASLAIARWVFPPNINQLNRWPSACLSSIITLPPLLINARILRLQQFCARTRSSNKFLIRLSIFLTPVQTLPWSGS